MPNANKIQPIIKDIPPNGVIKTIHDKDGMFFISFNVCKYNEPLKSIIPKIKNSPAFLMNLLVNC